MSRKARTWAAAAALLLLIAGGTLAFGQITGTFAIFNAVVENPGNVLVGGWVPMPSGTSSAVASSSPYATATLNWTAAANPPVTSQTLQYADGGAGASASCPSAGSGSYGSFSTPAAGANTASVTGTNFTDWWCFEVNSVDGNWTTDYVTFPGVRLLVPTSFTECGSGCGTVNGFIDSGDTITITYNQAVSYSGGSVIICAYASGAIVVGDASVSGTSNSQCNGGAGDTATIGTITGLTIASTRLFYASGVTASGSTITVTVGTAGGNGANSHTSVSGTGTFTAAGSTITATTGGWNQCSLASSCTPTHASSF